MSPHNHDDIVEDLIRERYPRSDWPNLYYSALIRSRGAKSCGIETPLSLRAECKLERWGKQGRITKQMWEGFSQAVYRGLMRMKLDYHIAPPGGYKHER